MDTETLFYKEHVISGKNLELILHKEYTYLFNETDPFPVVKFSLTNCENLSEVEFENIDANNDGITADINKERNKTVLGLSDLVGTETKISCDSIVREDVEYRQSDLIDLLKLTKKEITNNDERAAMFYKRIENLSNTLKRDLDIINRKLEQANWLSTEAKKFLEGQQNAIQRVLQFIDKKEEEE